MSLRDLLEDLRQPLDLRGALPASIPASGQPTAGFFNPVHPHTIQVLGDAGAACLAALAAGARAALPAKLRRRGMAALIAAEGQADVQPWATAGMACLRSPRPAHDIVYALRRTLAEQGAARKILHGVFLDVHGQGLLITGAAGAGKSALALDLVGRGHALIADDAVEVLRPAAGILLGRCPPVLKGYLEVRGLGILDIRRMHGARAVRAQRRRLDLIVRLLPGRARKLGAGERLGGRRSASRVLGQPVPVLSLPAQSGHNLAPLVEAACLDQRLRQYGVDAVAALSRRQARAIKRGK